MPVRSNRLPRNQSAGCVDEEILRIVHQRPPKNIAPSKTPVTKASARLTVSFVTILIYLSHLLVFLVYPVPGIQTADCQADNQQHQRPGMFPWMTIVQPDTERRAGERRNHHRPANKPHHAQAKPDALRGVTLRL